MVGKRSVQGQIALSLTGKVPGCLPAPSAPHIPDIFHKNSRKLLSTAGVSVPAPKDEGVRALQGNGS